MPDSPDRMRTIRHALRTPVNHMVGYGELLIEEAEDTGHPEIVSDLQRIVTAARDLGERINRYFTPDLGSGRDAEDGLEADISRIQHELRTPLNQVIGYSELLQEEADERGVQDFVPDLQRIDVAARHLLALISNLIDDEGAGRHETGQKTQAATLGHPVDPQVAGRGRQAASRRLAGSLRRPGLDARGEAFWSMRRPHAAHGTILVVDDNEMNRDVLEQRLTREGHHVDLAVNGIQALELMRARPYDVVLLDILMPEMDGLEVLEHLKGDDVLRHVPVIVLSALEGMESIVRCIEMGAEDYLHKPFDPVLLRARIGASLEKKRLRDQEQAFLAAIKREQERSEHLLLNILPAEIADRLKRTEAVIADSFEDASVLFADIVGFTPMSARASADVLVRSLNDIFSALDRIASQHGLEKIKMIGDAYMAVAGVPIRREDHAIAAAEMALAIQSEIGRFTTGAGHPYSMRVGINCGPLVAGVIGIRKFAYDLWGDTVNTASRMESSAPPGSIQVTPAAYVRLRHVYTFQPRGPITVKGKGRMRTYILTGRTPASTQAHST